MTLKNLNSMAFWSKRLLVSHSPMIKVPEGG
jgi:hypothetical protein